VPLFGIVGLKLRLLFASLGALQGVSNFPVIGDSDSLKGYFFLELLPSQDESSAVHGRLLPLCVETPAFRSGNAGEARQVPRDP
jgi:hypothetical protein